MEEQAVATLNIESFPDDLYKRLQKLDHDPAGRHRRRGASPSPSPPTLVSAPVRSFGNLAAPGTEGGGHWGGETPRRACTRSTQWSRTGASLRNTVTGSMGWCILRIGHEHQIPDGRERPGPRPC